MLKNRVTFADRGSLFFFRTLKEIQLYIMLHSGESRLKAVLFNLCFFQGKLADVLQHSLKIFQAF